MHLITVNIHITVVKEEAEETILLAQAGHLSLMMHSLHVALFILEVEEEVEAHRKADIKIEDEVRAHIFVDSQLISQHHMTRTLGMTISWQILQVQIRIFQEDEDTQDFTNQEEEVEEEEDQARKAFQEWKFNKDVRNFFY